MPIEFVPIDRNTPYLFPPSIQDYLPVDHLARFVEEIVDQLDMGDLQGVYAGKGKKPYHPAMLVARFLAGFPHGTFFGVAALVAAGLVERARRAQAVSMVLLGLTIANLIGVPAVTAIGQWFGWRDAFAIVGGLALLTLLLVWLWVPKVAGDKQASPLRELSALTRKQVLLTLAIGAIGSGGMFSFGSSWYQ